MKDYPIEKAYYRAELSPEDPNDTIPLTTIQAGYSREDDAHVVCLYFEGTEQAYQFTPTEALELAACMTLAAHAAIRKDNS